MVSDKVIYGGARLELVSLENSVLTTFQAASRTHVPLFYPSHLTIL
jgi:hypothetical protein